MKNANGLTPFVKEEFRLAKEFAAEMSGFGLEVSNNFSGHYSDDTEHYILYLQTKPYPLAGNSALVKSLRAVGYHVQVYEPYGWNKRRGFSISVSRTIDLKKLKED